MKHLFLTLLALSTIGYAAAQGNPSSAQAEAARNNPCTDPWINIAWQQLSSRPNGEQGVCDCDPRNYNNGSWSNFAELLGYVRQYRSSAVRLNYAKMQDGSYVVQAIYNNAPLGIVRVDAQGRTLASGGSAVAAGGLGTLGASSRNHRTATSNGSFMVGVGGQQLRNVFPNQPGFSYTTASGGQAIRTSGQGAIATN
ncbi:hypothetical protein [Hymenobacter oligotrophus]|nr:hypothetical protein [Hymenobacter oligotrophus]